MESKIHYRIHKTLPLVPFQTKMNPVHVISSYFFNLLKTKRRLLYLKTQFVPRCKHFLPRL